YVCLFVHFALTCRVITIFMYNICHFNLYYYPFEMLFGIIGLTILLFEDSISEADRIKKLSEDLYETNRLKDLLITSISQELQTPIQSIENMTKIINEN